ncbi:hypothetical protein CMV_014233 [Castanea mollissima]|uniref:Uncharacterized protein n=1 Tax=Castanea mollissima TaxID=60419 RepID=A0A8J4RC06_9ROSI|nr:hypothetical protein CMV_014233 [Castanea mollissima]
MYKTRTSGSTLYKNIGNQQPKSWWPSIWTVEENLTCKLHISSGRFGGLYVGWYLVKWLSTTSFLNGIDGDWFG